MDILSRIVSALQTVFTTIADSIARETGFVKRQRKFSGANFVQSLVFGWMSNPDAASPDFEEELLRQRHHRAVHRPGVQGGPGRCGKVVGLESVFEENVTKREELVLKKRNEKIKPKYGYYALKAYSTLFITTIA